MNSQKLYELHVSSILSYFVVDLQRGISYPKNQFPPEFAHMDLEYINAITEVVPGPNVAQKDEGTFFIRHRIWPFKGLTIDFEYSEAAKKKMEEDEDELVMAGLR